MFTECGMDVQIHGKWDLDERHHMEFLIWNLRVMELKVKKK
jgi:hypothetical protein